MFSFDYYFHSKKICCCVELGGKWLFCSGSMFWGMFSLLLDLRLPFSVNTLDFLFIFSLIPVHIIEIHFCCLDTSTNARCSKICLNVPDISQIAGQLQDLLLIIVVLDTLVSFVFQGYYCKWLKEIGYCILKL